MENNNDKVSVVIPVYNSEKFLSQSIESVLNQTYKNIEIIAVNDGSTDDSLKILQKYSDKIIIITYGNIAFKITTPDRINKVGIGTVRYSKIGRELFPMTNAQTIEEFPAYLVEQFKEQNIEIEIVNRS